MQKHQACCRRTEEKDKQVGLYRILESDWSGEAVDSFPTAAALTVFHSNALALIHHRLFFLR